MELTYNQLILYGFIAGLITGLILGLIILFLGIKKGKSKLGIIGLVCCVVVGAISGVLSIVAAIVFIWLILRKPVGTKPEEVEEANENPFEDSIKVSENSPGNQVSGD